MGENEDRSRIENGINRSLVANPECEEIFQMDSNTDFLQLLKQLNGEMFYQIFVDHQIDQKALRYLTEHHLDALIPKNLYGSRVFFEHHLKRWQKTENVEQNVSMEQADTNTTLPLASPNLIHMFNGFDFNKFSAERILKRTLNGQTIIKFYENNKSLNLKYRRLLANCIVEYLLEKKVDTNPKLFDKIAETILCLFPSESKDIYYLHQKGRKPAGSLYSKYHNSIARLRKEGLWSTPIPVEVVLEEIEDASVFDSGENAIASKEWLKYNVEPFDEVVNKWGETFSARQNFLKERHSLNDILEDWPILKQSFGHKLVAADFSRIHTGKANLLFEKWEPLSVSLMTLCEIRLRHPDSLELIRKYKDANFKAEYKNAIILYLSHDVVRPSARKCVLNENKRRKYSKTTVEDSRNAFLLWAQTTSELQSILKFKTDELFRNKKSLQPIICCVGSSNIELQDFYVYYANIFYKLDNIILALDVCFKLFHMLDLQYPEECRNIWLFFQDYIYNIPLKDCEKNVTLSAILSDIKNPSSYDKI